MKSYVPLKFLRVKFYYEIARCLNSIFGLLLKFCNACLWIRKVINVNPIYLQGFWIRKLAMNEQSEENREKMQKHV